MHEAIGRFFWQAIATTLSWVAFGFLISSLLLSIGLAIRWFEPNMIEPLWTRMMYGADTVTIMISILVFALLGACCAGTVKAM